VTTSSYCELLIRPTGSRDEPGERVVVHSWEIPGEPSFCPVLSANRPVELTLTRGQAESLLRLRLEADEIMRLTPDRREWTVQIGEYLREQYGLADLVVEEAPAEEPYEWSPVLTMTLRIEADPAFQRLQEALVRELEEVHFALARDFVSRTWHRHVGRVGDVRSFSAEDDLEHLQETFTRLEKTLLRIGEQPSQSLRRTRVVARWRPGYPIGSQAAHHMARGGDVRRDAHGRIHPPSKTLIDRPKLATDIEEHRHLRNGLLRLAERSASLARHCRRATDLFEEEESRWSGPALEAKTRTRLASLETTRREADALQVRFRKLLRRLPYLEGLGPPRTTLHPTPIFLGRPPYREAYRALRDARRNAGGRFDGEGLRVRFRNLATLYEYWLFVRVVGLLRHMYGVPDGNGAFTLIDEVYRPELAPGQQFRFRLPRGDVVTATYEPDFPPVAERHASTRYRAAFVSGTLRPDVTIELEVPGRDPVILALDAKSGRRFHKLLEKLRDVSEYLWLIHDPATGHQPIRQLFLVHRDRDQPAVCNVTGYLESAVSPRGSHIVGAVHAQPGETETLRTVILRFLETFRMRPRSRASHQLAGGAGEPRGAR